MPVSSVGKHAGEVFGPISRTADAASGAQSSELGLPRLQATRGRLCLGRLNLKSASQDTSPCSWNRQAEGEAPPERTRKPDGTKRLTEPTARLGLVSSEAGAGRRLPGSAHSLGSTGRGLRSRGSFLNASPSLRSRAGYEATTSAGSAPLNKAGRTRNGPDATSITMWGNPGRGIFG